MSEPGKYTLSYSETSKQVLTMVLLPSCGTAGILGLAVALPRMSEEWVAVYMTCSMLGLMVFCAWFFVRHVVLVCEATLREEGLVLQLPRRSLLYGFERLSCGWGNIRSLSRGTNEGKPYYSISLHAPSRTMLLQPLKPGSTRVKESTVAEEEPDLWERLQEHVKRHEARDVHAPPVPVTRHSVYDNLGVRAVAVLLALLMVGFPFLPLLRQGSVPEGFWSRLVGLYLLGVPFCGAVYASWRRGRRREQ
jgi:hypothetical protein